MEPLFKNIEAFCAERGFSRTYWVALSGGVDSIVLLHLIVSLRDRYPLILKAVHVNHQLSPHANEWEAHCKTICRFTGN